jgi:hypothetical protein
VTGTRARINLSRAVQRFALTADLQLLRQSSGTYVDGRWVEGALSAVSVTASVQPFAGDRQALPEGMRGREVWSVWSTSELRPVMRADGTTGDYAVFEGKQYQFFELQDWSHNGAYWEGKMAKVDQ